MICIGVVVIASLFFSSPSGRCAVRMFSFGFVSRVYIIRVFRFLASCERDVERLAVVTTRMLTMPCSYDIFYVSHKNVCCSA